MANEISGNVMWAIGIILQAIGLAFFTLLFLLGFPAISEQLLQFLDRWTEKYKQTRRRIIVNNCSTTDGKTLEIDSVMPLPIEWQIATEFSTEMAVSIQQIFLEACATSPYQEIVCEPLPLKVVVHNCLEYKLTLSSTLVDIHPDENAGKSLQLAAGNHRLLTKSIQNENTTFTLKGSLVSYSNGDWKFHENIDLSKVPINREIKLINKDDLTMTLGLHVCKRTDNEIDNTVDIYIYCPVVVKNETGLKLIYNQRLNDGETKKTHHRNLIEMMEYRLKRLEVGIDGITTDLPLELGGIVQCIRSGSPFPLKVRIIHRQDELSRKIIIISIPTHIDEVLPVVGQEHQIPAADPAAVKINSSSQENLHPVESNPVVVATNSIQQDNSTQTVDPVVAVVPENKTPIADSVAEKVNPAVHEQQTEAANSIPTKDNPSLGPVKQELKDDKVKSSGKVVEEELKQNKKEGRPNFFKNRLFKKFLNKEEEKNDE